MTGAIVVSPCVWSTCALISCVLQMGLALGMTGWWMYIDVPQTARAVVVCVIVFNAAFGYRCGCLKCMPAASSSHFRSRSWGPIPWLYPPEVGSAINICPVISHHTFQIMPLTVRAKGVSLSTAVSPVVKIMVHGF